MHKVQPTVTLSHACNSSMLTDYPQLCVYSVEEDLGLIPINHNLVLSYLSGIPRPCMRYIYISNSVLSDLLEIVSGISELQKNLVYSLRDLF